MRNFKYLIFIFLSILSIDVFALPMYTIENLNTNYGSEASACDAFQKQFYPDYKAVVVNSGTSQRACRIIDLERYVQIKLVQGAICAPAGTPIPVYFQPGTEIPLRTCKKNPDGTFCITEYTGDKNRPVVISGSQYQNIIHRSQSEIPSPSCEPLFSNDKCDPKDPLGGCYKPPNDNCNRMSDGSIYCPPDEPPPPIKSGCQNNATYCDMPPTGCGSGYVPGSYNGKQICVLNSNPPPTDPKDPPPAASEPPPTNPPTDPKDPPTDPKDPPPPPPPPPPPTSNNDALLRAIIDAINAVNNKLTWVKNEIVNAISNVAKKIDLTNEKLDTANKKLDTVNDSVKETTAAVNASADVVKKSVEQSTTTIKTAVDANTAATNNVKAAVDANTNSTANKLNDVVNAINNKPVGGGGVTNVDLKETNGYLKDIKEWLGVADNSNPEDGKLNIVKEEIDTNFDGTLFKVSGTCPPPMQISFSLLQSYTIQFSYDTFCYGATLARPWVIFIGMLTAFFIVTGHYRGANND
ncbi:virulence factor TspB C-terminal domain-related protein [Acinetobacter nosocomialis]|uniref:virulence factor TspB C-terminal domain-related protein n=1 Tax=Acinetobacter nosocomialis TaxID=106654 RepID=UPI0034E2C63E